jgi:hypothetical protein
MSNYVLSIKTKEGSFYGGSIKAASVDDADEAAFSIYTNLQQEGFNSIQDIEAIDYFNLNGSLPIPDNIELFYYVTYHRLNIDENVEPILIERLIKYFETREEYEKCSFLLKMKNTRILEPMLYD